MREFYKKKKIFSMKWNQVFLSNEKYTHKMLALWEISMTQSSWFSNNGRRCGCLGASWKRKVKKPVEDRKLESKIAGWGPIVLSEADHCSLSWQAVSACAHYRITIRMAAWAELGSACPCASDRGASLLRSSVTDTMGATDLLHQQAFCCCGQK